MNLTQQRWRLLTVSCVINLFAGSIYAWSVFGAALAASRIGIRDVIIPEENRKDVEEIPENVRSEINFIPAADVDTVFRNAIEGL